MYEDVKVKPIQATEIKDLKIAQDVIDYIRNNPITPEETERMRKEAEDFLSRMMKK
jgi:hypothetical protein